MRVTCTGKLDFICDIYIYIYICLLIVWNGVPIVFSQTLSQIYPVLSRTGPVFHRLIVTPLY